MLCLCLNRTTKHKSLELITRSNAKLKLALLQYFSNNKNMLNVKPLWLMCDSMLLLFNVDGLSLESSRPIHLGSHFPTTQVISPLSSLESQHLRGPSILLFFLKNYLL